MESTDILKAVFGFLLGLVAKMVYDIWKDARKEKNLFFTKTILSSFMISNLDKNIREQTQVLYDKHPVESIHLVRVEVRNSGLSAIKNQAFTVRFSEKASIIGNPQSNSSSEDLRYAELDSTESTQNSRRFKLYLLRKDKKLAWDFAVINHARNDFQVEHGIITRDGSYEGVDLDVASKVSSEKAQLDLVERLIKIIQLLILIQVIALVRNAVAISIAEAIVKPVANLGIIIIWFLIIQEVRKVVGPLMDWFVSTKSTFDNKGTWINSIEGGIENLIGNDMISHQVIDRKTMRKLLDKVVDYGVTSSSPKDEMLELPPSESDLKKDI